MSTQERQAAELEIAASGPRYTDPVQLAARMAFWDLGYKYEPRCEGGKSGPGDVTDCKCVKAGSYTAVFCNRTDGIQCMKIWPLVGHNGWTEDDLKEKGIADCAVNFPLGVTSAPVAAAIVDESLGRNIILLLAALLVLGSFSRR